MLWYSIHVTADKISAEVIQTVETIFKDAWCSGGKRKGICLYRTEFYDPKAITYYLPPLNYDFSTLEPLSLIPVKLQSIPTVFEV